MIESSNERALAQLDALMASARDHEVSDRGARACIAGVQERSALHQRENRGTRTAHLAWALGGGLVVAAVFLWMGPRNQQPGSPIPTQAVASAAPTGALPPIQIGERVALTSSEGSAYVVTAATATRTEIAIQRGSVTARLYPNAQRDHELVLNAGDLEVRATGTIFTVGVDATGIPYSLVHEGTVAVRRGQKSVALAAGEAFPSSAPRDEVVASAAQQLVRHDLLIAAAPLPAEEIASVDAPDAAPGTTSANKDIAADEPVQLWRRARALRSTGQSEQAIAILARLTASGDATWAPLAQLEMARLYDSDLSQPAKALAQARAFLERYARHELAQEARDLACQALAQLGRSDPALCPASR